MTEQASLEAVRARILALYGGGMHARALTAAEEALAVFPDDAWLHAVRADLLDATGRPDLAVPAARVAISLAPEMGYAHRVLADALMSGGAKSKLAVEAASDAVRLDPTEVAYYTLVRALVQHRSGTRRAADVARTLGEEYPQSVLAPLAMALVAMRRSGVLTTWRWWAVAVFVVLTRGLGLVMLLALWAFNAIRRVPHLREADRHLRRALEMDPSSPTARLLAVDVLRARFRFGQAVDQQVAVGALDAQLIDAGEVVRRIGQRVAVAVVAAFVVWSIPGYYLHRQLEGAVSAPVTGAAAALLVVELRRRQSRALPPALRAALDCQTLPPLAAAAVATFVMWMAQYAHAHDAYYRAGSYFSAAVALAGFVAAAAVHVRGRRSPS